MKTSNKLLIALASSFLIVPLVGMVYENTKYVDAKDFKYTEAKPRKFSDLEKGLYAQKTEVFSGVEIADAMQGEFSVTYVKDTQTGFKVREQLKDKLSFSVNANGILEVKLKEQPERNQNITITVYGPSFNNCKVANASNFNINAELDTLQLDLSNIGRFYINTEKKIARLTVKADKVEDISVWTCKIGDFNVSLNTSRLEITSSMFKTLNIDAKNESVVDLDQNDEDLSSVEQLVLKTTGKNVINMNNTPLKQISGSLSDSTKVNMPIVYIRQMLK